MAWTPVTISKKVGPSLDNNEEDVKKIQMLLNSVRIEPKLQVSGAFDQDTSTAIGNFQKIWGGKPNYRIEPGGTWMQRLNDTIKPLTLKSIKLISIRLGGYEITYEGFIPPKGYKVMFYLPSSFTRIPSDAIDITRQGLVNKQAIIRLKIKDTLPQLLRLIESKGVWGSLLACNLYLVREDGQVVSASNQVNVSTPVKPYDGPIKLNMAHIDPPMHYVGVKTPATQSGVTGEGRFFWPQPIDGRRYFAYKSKFETDPDKRGFDCTTYVGTILGLRPPTDIYSGEMWGRGEDTARMIGAEPCEFEYAPGKKKIMENIDLPMMKYFFANNSMGAFIMWTSGHVMLVVDNLVHEFNIPIGSPGYWKRDVLHERPWLVKGMKFNIRKIPSGMLP